MEDYIAGAASPAVAATYVDAVIDYCRNLSVFPLRGTQRSDIREGLRITNYRKKTAIAYSVNAATVQILPSFMVDRTTKPCCNEMTTLMAINSTSRLPVLR